MFAVFFVLLILISLALLIANIKCFKTKKYLYLFINCMLFLPNYYGIEINDALPLITVKRMMLVAFLIYAYKNRRRDFKIKNIDFKSLPKPYYFLGGYFVFRILSNLFYVFTYEQAVKTIFFIIIEQLLLIVAVYMLAPTKEEIDILVKSIVSTATVMFVLGIIESFTHARIFDLLYTVSRYLLNERYERLGLLRSTASMGIPGMFGNMCILVLPLILYMYECSRNKKYLVSVGLCVLAIIHSGARSDIFFLIFTLGIYCIYVLRGKERRLLFGKNAMAVVLSLLIFISVLSVISPYYKYFYVGTAKSILNEVGFDFDLSEGAPDESVGFGKNADGGLSRTMQFSGISYAAGINPVFGLGSGAQNRGDIQYYYKNKWRVFKTYDLGVVEIFCDEGIVGLIGVVSALLYILLASGKNRMLQMMLAIYVMTTLSTVNMFEFLFLYIILAFERFAANNYAASHKY